MPFPATACLVQHKIGATGAAAFDLEAACSGFIYGLEIGQQFIMSRTYDTVLVIGAEKLSAITDWKDRNTCVLFGDGAGAAVLQNREKSPRSADCGDGRGRRKGEFAFHARRRQPVPRQQEHGRCPDALSADGRQGNVQERRSRRCAISGHGSVAPVRN